MKLAFPPDGQSEYVWQCLLDSIREDVRPEEPSNYDLACTALVYLGVLQCLARDELTPEQQVSVVAPIMNALHRLGSIRDGEAA